MFVGHYSASLAAKAIAPKAPLWVLFLAAQFVDVFWSLFILMGIEHVRIIPSLASVPLDLYYMPYTHSLLATVFWSAAAFGLCKYLPFMRMTTRDAMIVSLVVASHWFLDLLVHRPDLAVIPGYKVGFGLWEFPWTAYSLEMVLFLGAAILMFRALGPENPLRLKAMIFVAVLAVIQTHSYIAPPAAGMQVPQLAISALFSFLAFALVAKLIETKPKQPN